MFLRRLVELRSLRRHPRERPGEAHSRPRPAADRDRSLSSALGRARDQDAVARTLLEACLSLLDVDFGAVALVSEDGFARARPPSACARQGHGLVGGGVARLRAGAVRDRERRLRRRARRRVRRRPLAAGQSTARRQGRREERRLRSARLRGERAGRAHPRDDATHRRCSTVTSSRSCRRSRPKQRLRSTAHARPTRSPRRSNASGSSPRSAARFAPSSTSTPFFGWR